MFESSTLLYVVLAVGAYFAYNYFFSKKVPPAPVVPTPTPTLLPLDPSLLDPNLLLPLFPNLPPKLIPLLSILMRLLTQKEEEEAKLLVQDLLASKEEKKV